MKFLLIPGMVLLITSCHLFRTSADICDAFMEDDSWTRFKKTPKGFEKKEIMKAFETVLKGEKKDLMKMYATVLKLEKNEDFQKTDFVLYKKAGKIRVCVVLKSSERANAFIEYSPGSTVTMPSESRIIAPGF